jgi:hypothetical protein
MPRTQNAFHCDCIFTGNRFIRCFTVFPFRNPQELLIRVEDEFDEDLLRLRWLGEADVSLGEYPDEETRHGTLNGLVQPLHNLYSLILHRLKPPMELFKAREGFI